MTHTPPLPPPLGRSGCRIAGTVAGGCRHGPEATSHFDLAHLAATMRPYGTYPWDRSLDSARTSIAGAPPTDAALDVRTFLKKWRTRLALNPASTEVFVTPFADWTVCAAPSLGHFASLSALSNSEIDDLGDLYFELSSRRAAVNRNGVIRRFGPTGTAKVLLLLCDESVPALDQAIRNRLVGGDSSRGG